MHLIDLNVKKMGALLGCQKLKFNVINNFHVDKKTIVN